MTDNEIIQALELCNSNFAECPKECPMYTTKFDEKTNCIDEKNGIMALALDLINRQKAEIERLQKAYEVEATDNMLVNSENDELKAKLAMAEDYLNPLPFKNAYDEAINKAKSEAIKEFAEKINEIHISPSLKATTDRLIKELSEVSDNAR